MRLVITGGGTGGHIFAGVAIAQEFCAQGKAAEVVFIGSETGLETKLVPKAGFKLETLKLGKLVGQSIFQRILTLFQIPIAVLKSIFILKRFKPNMVIGVGGYAAGPCIIASRILGIPTGVLEQNSVVGFTNRIASKLAHHVFLAFEEVPQGLPYEKCIFSGNPTRSNLKPFPNKQKPFVVFAFGGSQGATGINKMMIEAAQVLKDKGEFQFVHQTGPKDFEWVKKSYAELQIPAEVFAFIDDMQAQYNRASIVICRAGSGTISELGATKNAAVFVPFPFAAQNHQEVNARTVAKSGAAHVLIQGKNTGVELADLILELAIDDKKLHSMRNKMSEFYRPDAAKRIIDVMKTHSLLQADAK